LSTATTYPEEMETMESGIFSAAWNRLVGKVAEIKSIRRDRARRGAHSIWRTYVCREL